LIFKLYLDNGLTILSLSINFHFY